MSGTDAPTWGKWFDYASAPAGSYACLVSLKERGDWGDPYIQWMPRTGRVPIGKECRIMPFLMPGDPLANGAAPQPAASDLPHDVVRADEKLGAWLAAALDDENVCAEMKADIAAWFAAREPQGSSRQWPAFVYDSEDTPAPSTSTEEADDELSPPPDGYETWDAYFENPPPPTEALRQLFRDYRANQAKGTSTEEALRAENARLLDVVANLRNELRLADAISSQQAERIAALSR
ncbi:hypothetical protein N7I30_13715 [Aurantimonas litoralis]|nr:hypothetical protein [Aurantimonas litoralis]